MSKWCCEWFDRFIDSTGEKGFSIVAYRDGDYKSFYIQARTFEQETVDEFEKTDLITGTVNCPELRDRAGRLIPITISQQFPLDYCPRCGCDLNELIKSNLLEFDRLVDEHIRYRN